MAQYTISKTASQDAKMKEKEGGQDIHLPLMRAIKPLLNNPRKDTDQVGALNDFLVVYSNP